MPDAPQAGARTGSEVGVVGRDTPVPLDANHLAQRLGYVLGRATDLALTKRDEKRLVAPEHEARAIVSVAHDLWGLTEDNREVLQRVAYQLGTRDGRAGCTRLGGGARLGIAQVDVWAGRKIGVERDVEQPDAPPQPVAAMLASSTSPNKIGRCKYIVRLRGGVVGEDDRSKSDARP